MKRYIKAAFDTWVPDWLKDDKNALSALSRQGIDLRNANFSTSKTGRADEQYVIYYLENPRYRSVEKLIWIPGIYNDEHRMDNPYDNSYTAIKYIPKKYLPIKDVVYVNIRDNQKPSRERYQDPRYDSHGHYAGQYYEKPSSWSEGGWSSSGRKTSTGRYGGGQKRDKSGYIIPNPDERLLNFYSSKEGLGRLADKVSSTYESLVDLRNRLFEVDFSNFGKNYDGESDYSSTAYQNMMEMFGRSVRDYRIALNNLESAKKYADSEDGWYNRHTVQHTFQDLKSIQRNIERIQKILDTERD